MDTYSILLFRKREQERVFELKAQKDTLATQFDDIVSEKVPKTNYSF